MFTVEHGIKSYGFTAPDGTASGTVEYGEMAELDYQGKRYGALCMKDEQDEVISVLGDEWVYELNPAASKVEDVTFDDEDEDEVDVDAEEDEEGDEGDEDEDGEPV